MTQKGRLWFFSVLLDAKSNPGGRFSAPCYGDKLRLIRYIDPETGQSLTFLTNHFDQPALTIAAIYKSRWYIELLAKRSLCSLVAVAPFANAGAGLLTVASFAGSRFAFTNKLLLVNPSIVTTQYRYALLLRASSGTISAGILQVDHTEPAHQRFLRHQHQRRENPDLGCHLRLSHDGLSQKDT